MRREVGEGERSPHLLGTPSGSPSCWASHVSIAEHAAGNRETPKIQSPGSEVTLALWPQEEQRGSVVLCLEALGVRRYLLEGLSLRNE